VRRKSFFETADSAGFTDFQKVIMDELRNFSWQNFQGR